MIIILGLAKTKLPSAFKWFRNTATDSTLKLDQKRYVQRRRLDQVPTWNNTSPVERWVESLSHAKGVGEPATWLSTSFFKVKQQDFISFALRLISVAEQEWVPFLQTKWQGYCRFEASWIPPWPSKLWSYQTKALFIRTSFYIFNHTYIIHMKF